jgi:hypothetical protein
MLLIYERNGLLRRNVSGFSDSGVGLPEACTEGEPRPTSLKQCRGQWVSYPDQ